MFSRVAPLLLIASLAAGPARADDGARSPRSDPLAPIVAEALRANLGFAQQRLAERAADAEARAALGALLPSVSVESRLSRLDGELDIGRLLDPVYATLDQLSGTGAFPSHVDVTLPSRHESRIRVTQPLVNETARAAWALARARRDGRRLETAVAARSLAAGVQIAWLEAAAARRQAGILSASLDVVRENERVAERLVAAGSATPEVFHRARADRAEVEQQLDEARAQQDAAVREVNRILRRPLDQPLDSIPEQPFEAALPLSEAETVQRALAGREELREADAGIAAAAAGHRVATAEMLPSVAFAFDYGWRSRDLALRDDQHDWSASLVASWNVFDGGRDPALRAAAGFERDRARAGRRELADRIAAEARDAHQAAEVAHAAIATADERLESARRTSTLVRRRFEEGAASAFELVEARTTLTRAELNRALTGYRYAIRRVELERVAALRDLSHEEGVTR